MNSTQSVVKKGLITPIVAYHIKKFCQDPSVIPDLMIYFRLLLSKCAEVYMSFLLLTRILQLAFLLSRVGVVGGAREEQKLKVCIKLTKGCSQNSF